MSRRMVPADYSPLFPWLTQQGPRSQAEFWSEFQDLCSRGMDKALGLQESSLDQAAQLHSQALDLYRNAFYFPPLLGDYFKMATEFLTACMELQMNAVTLMFSGRLPESSNYSASNVATTAGEPAEERASEGEPRKTPASATQAAAARTGT
jgi:hypothetical protein